MPCRGRPHLRTGEDWSKAVQAPHPIHANQRAGHAQACQSPLRHALIGCRSHARIRVGLSSRSAASVSLTRGATTARCAICCCAFEVPASYHGGRQCDATASMVPLIEIQNIKRTALCPRCARLTDANSLSLVRYRFEVRAFITGDATLTRF